MCHAKSDDDENAGEFISHEGDDFSGDSDDDHIDDDSGNEEKTSSKKRLNPSPNHTELPDFTRNPRFPVVCLFFVCFVCVFLFFLVTNLTTTTPARNPNRVGFYSSVDTFASFLAGLQDSQGHPFLSTTHEIPMFSEFEPETVKLAAAPFSETGLVAKFNRFLRELKGATSTMGNHVRAVRWWILYKFLTKSFAISFQTMKQIWVCGAKFYGALGKTSEHTAILKQMTGALLLFYCFCLSSIFWILITIIMMKIFFQVPRSCGSTSACGIT